MIEEIITFLNYLISKSENEEDIEINIEKILKEKNIKYDELKKNLIKEIILSFKKRKNSQSLISYDWQISITERQSEVISSIQSKIEKVEIKLKLNSYDNNKTEYKTDLLKMGFAEFSEIYQNLKRIDNQLHIFKN